MDRIEKLFLNLEANHPEYTVAIFDFTQMTQADIERLCKIIHENPYLTTIRLIECRLDDGQIELLSQAIMQNDNLIEVDIPTSKDQSAKTRDLIECIQCRLQQNSQRPSP